MQSDQELAQSLATVFPAFQAEEVLRISEKSAAVSGWIDGERAVAKLLQDRNSDWDSWFAQEIRFYRLAKENPLPVNVPHLIAASGDGRAFIISHIDGSPIGDSRLYRKDTDAALSDVLIDSFDQLAKWKPAGLEIPVQTVEATVEKGARYVSLGSFLPEDYETLAFLASFAQTTLDFAHGDPVAFNVLKYGNSIALIDWELSGFRPAGFDLAVLWVMLMDVPRMQAAVSHAIVRREEPYIASFLSMITAILGREIGNFSRAPVPESQRRISQFRAALGNIGIDVRLLSKQSAFSPRKLLTLLSEV